MKRPNLWYELPYSIMEVLVNRANIEYDPYESSRADEEINVLNNPTYYHHNNEIVQEYYDSLTDDKLKDIIIQLKLSLESQLEELKNLQS